MNLTKNFSLEEMTGSWVAEHSKPRIENVPDEQQVENLRRLCQKVLQPLRDHLGVKVIINSGYRSQELNEAVCGVENSQHLLGEAADIHVPSKRIGREWMRWMMDNLQFDQLIWEGSWIHVSYREGRNRQMVIWKPKK